jgi:ABC-type lipopolysaccharide export system ATPase subunit
MLTSNCCLSLWGLLLSGMPVTIITKDLVKRYRQRTVVNHVSIKVGQGENNNLLPGSWIDKT